MSFSFQNTKEELQSFFNTKRGKDTVIFFTILLFGVFSFFLGRFSLGEGSRVRASSFDAHFAWCSSFDKENFIASSVNVKEGGEKEIKGENDIKKEKTPQNEEKGSFVASKNGSVYHLEWCSGAMRIKEENKIYFSTKEEAEKKGYRPAKNCDGL
jgi:hypothetical protein